MIESHKLLGAQLRLHLRHFCKMLSHISCQHHLYDLTAQLRSAFTGDVQENVVALGLHQRKSSRRVVILKHGMIIVANSEHRLRSNLKHVVGSRMLHIMDGSPERQRQLARILQLANFHQAARRAKPQRSVRDVSCVDSVVIRVLLWVPTLDGCGKTIQCFGVEVQLLQHTMVLECETQKHGQRLLSCQFVQFENVEIPAGCGLHQLPELTSQVRHKPLELSVRHRFAGLETGP
mmetsp:Transcript_52240/g.138475  ORF Transcript_52240/g.138475 Transcript_52240/m.138475 type:complete len:234 (+) Transcript_52240:717-1418(+)